MFNRERVGSVDGPEDKIYGWAEIPNASKPGELVVHLQTTHFGAPYWVFKLGPETYGPDGLYEYSIVSDPFLVSRDSRGGLLHNHLYEIPPLHVALPMNPTARVPQEVLTFP